MGLWALLPPYTGPALNTETRVEVADHVLPALVMLGASAAAFLVSRRSAPRASAANVTLVSGFLVLLAGIWMTATHLPLVGQATRDEVTAAAAAYHTAPGVAVVVLGLVWIAVVWDETSPREA